MTKHPLDGEIRDGRHVLPVRVYYEDTDFTDSPLPSEANMPISAALRRFSEKSFMSKRAALFR